MLANPLHPLARRVVALLCLLLLGPLTARAQDIQVRDAWARATAPGQQTASIYLDLASSADAALVAVRTPLAKRAELHEMRMENGVMKMRAIENIALPARKTVRLTPGGLHIMLVGIERPLVAKETLPLELTIESPSGSRSQVAVQVPVRALAATGHGH